MREARPLHRQDREGGELNGWGLAGHARHPAEVKSPTEDVPGVRGMVREQLRKGNGEQERAGDTQGLGKVPR